MQRRTDLRPGPSLYSLILGRTVPMQVGVILLGLALPPLAVMPLHLQQRLIDEAIAAADPALVLWFAALWVGVVLASSAIKFAVIWLRGLIDETVTRVLRVALIEAQRRRPLPEGRKALGAATSVMAGEVDPLGGFAAEALNTPLIQGGTLIGVMGFMLTSEPLLALVGVLALAMEAVVTPILQGRINLLTARRIGALRRADADLIDAADPGGRRLFINGLRRIRQTYWLRLNWLKALLKVIRNLIDHGAEVAVIALGAWMVMRGDTEIGVVVAFLSGLRQLRGPWGELIDFYRRQADARVKYELVRAALNGGAIPAPAVHSAPAV